MRIPNRNLPIHLLIACVAIAGCSHTRQSSTTDISAAATGQPADQVQAQANAIMSNPNYTAEQKSHMIGDLKRATGMPPGAIPMK